MGRENLRGYTMMEIIIVMIIIGILATFAIHNYGFFLERTKTREAVGIVTTIYHAQKQHFLNEGCYESGTVSTQLNDYVGLQDTTDHFVGINAACGLGPCCGGGPLSITCNTVQPVLGSAQRIYNGTLYELYVSETGQIICYEPAQAPGPPRCENFCIRLGFPPW